MLCFKTDCKCCVYLGVRVIGDYRLQRVPNTPFPSSPLDRNLTTHHSILTGTQSSFFNQYCNGKLSINKVLIFILSFFNYKKLYQYSSKAISFHIVFEFVCFLILPYFAVSFDLSITQF